MVVGDAASVEEDRTMIVVGNRIPVAPGHEDVFEQRFAGRAGLVERRAGCRGFQLLRPIQGDCYVVLTWWVTEAHFRAWTESDEFREAHRHRPPAELFAGPNVFEMHEVIQRVDVAPAGS
jgi:heme-degrading monooxygenase HmoA